MPKRNRTPSLPSCYSTESFDEPSCREENTLPYVEHHDGRRFWGDRFYLNSSTDSSVVQYHNDNQKCSCGSREAYPTFPLVDFVNRSLKLKASVMGTYNIHPEWFRKTYPRFGARRESKKHDNISGGEGSIPTFVFHGHRGLQNALTKRVKHADEAEYDTDREGDDNDGGITSNLNHSHNLMNDTSLSSKFQYFLPVTDNVTEAAKHFVDNPSLQLCQVHCNWQKTPKASTRRVSTGKENAQANNAATRETKFGVHHPKFHLLFEESGDLVVIVTTSNLTPTSSSALEGSWVQRFRRRIKPYVHKDHQENDFGLVLQDFLRKLSESAAAAPGNSPFTNNKGASRFPIEEFLRQHIGLRSLSEFSTMYHFETAKAYLVPVIPGDYEYNPNDSQMNDNKKTSRYYYGRQRVRYILENLATSTPKISKKTQDKSKSDRLILQPTSLGNDWSRSQFAALIREYMGYYGESNNKPNQSNASDSTPSKRKNLHKKQKKQHDYSYQRDDFWVCNQADIVWPTDKFMIGAANSAKEWLGSDDANLLSPLEAAARKDGEVMNSFIFNSSRTFNACDIEFISRMAKYEPSKPCQVSSCNQTDENESNNAKAPHFKSIARLFQNHVAMQKRDVPPADAYFSWFLMTSACLSLGAQGGAMDQEANKQGENDEKSNYDESSSSLVSKVSYRNFELGVLFASHLPKKTKSESKTRKLSGSGSPDQEKEDRKSVVYCFHPHHCLCSAASTSNSTPELVHLPVPYNLKPQSYFNKGEDDENDDDDDEGVMNANPFFHEVLDESRCIGNMLLTPFGQQESN